MINIFHIQFHFLYPLTDKLFPMDYKIVSTFLEGVTVRWKDIARELGLSEQTIERINNAHQGNPEFCCKQMIEECLIGKEVKLNWQSLTEALRRLHMEDLVDMIGEYWGKLMKIFIGLLSHLIFFATGHHVRVQTMLHDDKLTFTSIDATAQQQLAVIVEPHWKHLAPYINPSASTGPESVKPVIDHLQRWRERMHPTFGDLSEILSHLYIQPPLPSNVQLPVTSLPSRNPDGGYNYILLLLCDII